MDEGIVQDPEDVSRCWWASGSEPYRSYHDQAWGRPTRDGRWIFEKNCLEGFPSGLSWLTILDKRENFRWALANFDIDRVARFNHHNVDKLMQDAGIAVRSKPPSTTPNEHARCGRSMVPGRP